MTARRHHPQGEAVTAEKHQMRYDTERHRWEVLPGIWQCNDKLSGAITHYETDDGECMSLVEAVAYVKGRLQS